MRKVLEKRYTPERIRAFQTDETQYLVIDPNMDALFLASLTVELGDLHSLSISYRTAVPYEEQLNHALEFGYEEVIL